MPWSIVSGELRWEDLAGTTGLEPATSDVTGRRSNQLNYVPAVFSAADLRRSQVGDFQDNTADRRRLPILISLYWMLFLPPRPRTSARQDLTKFRPKTSRLE